MGRYSRGQYRVNMQLPDLPSAWGRGHDAKQTLEFMNAAFDIYYFGRRLIESTEMDYKIGKKMKSRLESAAENDRWGSDGPNNLKEALRYLERTSKGPWWGYKERVTYYGGLFNADRRSAPPAIVEFMSDIESSLKELAVKAKPIGAETRRAQTAERNDDWETVGQVLQNVNSIAGKINHFMWLAPTAVEDRYGSLVSFADIFSTIHEGATVGTDLLTGKETEGMFGLMSTAVSNLPVLGGFYGLALSKVPGMIAGFEQFNNEYHFKKWYYTSMHR